MDRKTPRKHEGVQPGFHLHLLQPLGRMLRRLAMLKLAAGDRAAAFFTAFVFFLGTVLQLLDCLVFDAPLDAALRLLEGALAGRFFASTSSGVDLASLAEAFASARFDCRPAMTASGSSERAAGSSVAPAVFSPCVTEASVCARPGVVKGSVGTAGGFGLSRIAGKERVASLFSTG